MWKSEVYMWPAHYSFITGCICVENAVCGSCVYTCLIHVARGRYTLWVLTLSVRLHLHHIAPQPVFTRITSLLKWAESQKQHKGLSVGLQLQMLKHWRQEDSGLYAGQFIRKMKVRKKKKKQQKKQQYYCDFWNGSHAHMKHMNGEWAPKHNERYETDYCLVIPTDPSWTSPYMI